jgi:hypothetical protein
VHRVYGTQAITASNVKPTICSLYPRTSAMANAMVEETAIAASRNRSTLPISSGWIKRPLAISLTRYVVWPQSART